jgi:hypothetical protein
MGIISVYAPFVHPSKIRIPFFAFLDKILPGQRVAFFPGSGYNRGERKAGRKGVSA